MKKTLRISLIALLCAAATLFCAATGAFAWLAGILNSIRPTADKGSVIQQYFHCGSGTENDPFVITRPIHYYHLVELYQRSSSFASGGDSGLPGYYFQLGYDLAGNGTLQVYNYDEFGQTDGTFTDALNMAYYSDDYALLPIGTSDVPFNGTFDGSDLTIENLNVRATETISGTTYGTSDVGIFGYLGEDADVHNAYFENVSIDLSGTNALRTVTGHNTTVHDSDNDSTPDLVFAGYIAGHVYTTSRVQDVYVNDCTLLGGDAATCGFGYFGCVEDATTGTVVTQLGSEVVTLRTKGSDAGFGGSVEMDKLYNRVLSVLQDARANYTRLGANNYYHYTTEERVDIYEATEDSEERVERSYTDAGALTNQQRGYFSTKGGNYVLHNRTDTNSYLYVSSLTQSQGMTVTTYLHKNEFLDAFYIKSGTNCLSLTDAGALTNQTSEDQATLWVLDENDHLYTILDGTVTYLNRAANGTLTTSATVSTTWTRDAQNRLSVSVSGTPNYLSYRVIDPLAGWTLSPHTATYTISDGAGHYLSGTQSGVSNVNTASASSKWLQTNPGGNTAFYVTENGVNYYLGLNGGALGTSTTSTTWTRDSNGYYATVNGDKLYLTYDNGWKAVPIDCYKIASGTHYLTATTSAVSDSTQANSVDWLLSNPSGNTQFYTLIGGQKYYLTVDSGALTVSATPATWVQNGDSYYLSQNGKDYYLCYENGWKVKTLTYQLISDGAGHYLSLTNTGAIENQTQANATHWYFTASGAIYASVGNTTYYLRENNGLITTTQASSATEWETSGGSYYVEGDTTRICIGYDNGWKTIRVNNGTLIGDGNGNYLRVTGTGTTAFTSTTNIDLATRFTFSNTTGNPRGTISTTINTSTVYLRNYNNGTLQLTTTAGNATTWQNDGTSIYAAGNGNRSYYLIFDGTWQLSTSRSDTKYRISTGGNYMSANGTTLSHTTNASDALLFNATSGTISTVIDGTTYNLYAPTTNNGAMSLSDSNSRSWTTNGSRRYFSSGGIFGWGATNYYIRYYNDAWTVNTTQGNASALTFTEVDLTFSSATQTINDAYPTLTTPTGQEPAPEIDVQDASSAVPEITVDTVAADHSLSWVPERLQVVEKSVSTDRTGTYFPLRVDLDENDDYPEGYAVSPKNTGYIVSGAYSTTSSYTMNNTRYYPNADIRISGYDIENIDASYNANTNSFTSVYTVNASGNHVLTDAEKNAFIAYSVAEEQFLETLDGAENVYGLHFMNAKISTQHTIRAREATVLGTTYQNYELPEDSIDFNVIERGTINFFAGSYFPGNNAFFSLHRIYRDENDDISAIKEIDRVYQHATLKGAKPYIFRYTDGTYTNADGTYSGATSLAPGYDSTEVFNRSWITNPSGVSQEHKVYYFEIPCNKGEYALGSVSGKTGAYLMYLDIASNGGDAIESIVSSEGNDVTQSFNVEFRSAPDTVDHSIFQFAIDAPDGTDPSTFSCNVVFDKSQTGNGSYPSGLYTLTIVNHSNADLTLYTFLCDNDNDPLNDFPYAYRVVYTNATQTATIIPTLFENDYWKSVAGFTIPATGTAYEVTYS